MLYAIALTLAPAVRARAWEVSLRWEHWLGLLVWLVLFNLAHKESAQRLPERDPYLLPVAALLAGWGLLTIWRLFPGFGARQSVWLLVAVGLFVGGLRLPADLGFLRRYKYLWLTTGLLLTSLTLLFGTNPSGAGFPHLWLGCCGLYLQPSEPLKLLLVIYLAAYLADRFAFLTPNPGRRGAAVYGGGLSLLPLLAPTLFMTGLALALLLVQRDLGTASIFLFLYAVVVYVASGRVRILVAGGLATLLAALAGYGLFDVVRVRVDAWLNPWLDPSGRSYQIVQSLLAVANGGIMGRGPGLGNPNLVPIPHSDFIFTAIGEETGLVGAIALLVVLALLCTRSLRAALNAADGFRRYLAAGLAAYLIGQSILIIGGNLRLLPLTGVTLPFVSYGGSSLLTSFASLLILLFISAGNAQKPAPLLDPRPYLYLNAFFLLGLAATALLAGWWMTWRSPELLVRTDNPRRTIADRFVRRGALLDRHNDPLNATTGSPGEYTRQTLYPDLSATLGYTNPVYGQAGLERSLDGYLRGLQGNPGLTIWLNHLLYGQPPPGLDVRLSLSLEIQRVADEQLAGRRGALVLLNARSGEILALASQPTFDANRLEDAWDDLVRDPASPLLNRATQGLYPPGSALGPLLLGQVSAQGDLPVLPEDLSFRLGDQVLFCARPPGEAAWPDAIRNGCPGAVAALGRSLGGEAVLGYYENLGLFTAPQLRLPTNTSARPSVVPEAAAAALGEGLRVSPLQMALAAAALSGNGVRPAPYLITALNTPQAGWLILPPLSEPAQGLLPAAANLTARDLAGEGNPTWETLTLVPSGSDQQVTWYLAGTVPDEGGPLLALAVLLEEDNPTLAAQIGQAVLQAALRP